MRPGTCGHADSSTHAVCKIQTALGMYDRGPHRFEFGGGGGGTPMLRVRAPTRASGGMLPGPSENVFLEHLMKTAIEGPELS